MIQFVQCVFLLYWSVIFFMLKAAIGQIDRYMDRWMDDWMDGWRSTWMDEQVGGWVGAQMVDGTMNE